MSNPSATNEYKFFRGVILELPEKGLFGMVRSDDGTEMFFSHSNYDGHWSDFLSIGDRVVFRAQKNKSIWRPLSFYRELSSNSKMIQK